jgi:hypothetical protein
MGCSCNFSLKPIHWDMVPIFSAILMMFGRCKNLWEILLRSRPTTLSLEEILEALRALRSSNRHRVEVTFLFVGTGWGWMIHGIVHIYTYIIIYYIYTLYYIIYMLYYIYIKIYNYIFYLYIFTSYMHT